MVNPELTYFQQAVELVEQVGFPIFACWWFMFRAEKSLNKIFKSLEDLNNTVRNKL